MSTGSPELIRVQSVPAAHPYVSGALPDPARDPVALVPDPVVDPSDPDRWWPPRALDPDWLAGHAGAGAGGDAGIDVLHVHFGFDTCTPRQLEEVAAVARRHRTALVVTVHDLHNPHQPDPGPHRERVGVLVRAADAVLTLTEGAAAEVERTWGRRPRVLPHPHLAADRPRPTRPPGARPRVGVHLKDLRPNTDVDLALRGLADLATTGGVDCELRVHRTVLDPGHPRHDPGLAARLDALAAHPGTEVLVHDRLDDSALSRALTRLDVAVLPYRWGTHSGWLQLCRDLGVTVAAPDHGYYGEQVEAGAVARFRTGDPVSLVAAVRDLLTRPAPAPTTGAERVRRREHLRGAHLEVYRAALTRVRS